MLTAKGSAGKSVSLSLRHVANAINKEHIDLNTFFHHYRQRPTNKVVIEWQEMEKKFRPTSEHAYSSWLSIWAKISFRLAPTEPVQIIPLG